MAKSNAAAQYKADKDACSSLSGNAKDICIAEAKGKDNVALADAEAAYQNTAKHRETLASRVPRQPTTSPSKSATTWPATPRTSASRKPRPRLIKGKADAKVDRVVADTRQDAAVKQSDARKEASVDKLDADYKVAIEKCDALAGAAKDTCVSNAKAQFGKS